MSQVNRSVLLNASAAADVQNSGGFVAIPGLSPIPANRIINFSQINYRAEVAQVVTVGATAYTPTASTKYRIVIGDINRTNDGQREVLTNYDYTTPADITTLGVTAALQREAIHLALIAKIAAGTNTYVTAASLLLGTGITITDKGNYFPYPKQGMSNVRGATTVRVASVDGLGFAPTNIALTTPAVYGFGIGAYLANLAPVMDFMTGSAISGVIDAPKTISGAFAVSGQKYNAFSINFLQNATIAGVTGTTALQFQQQMIWVDNGAGASTTNLAGYLAFEKNMHRVAYNVYKNDAATVAEFFDKNFVLQGPAGAVPAGTTSLLNKFLTPYGLLNHVNIGAQLIVAPVQGANGLLIDQSVTTGIGAQYSPELATINAQEFVVGKTPFMAIFNYTATAVTGVNSFFGFRKKEAFQLDYNDYNDLATIGSNSTTGKFSTNGILGGAATVTTTSTTTGAVNSVRSQYIVKVSATGVVTCLANGVAYPVYSAGTTPLVFPAGTILVPFFQTTQITGTASVGVIDEMLAVTTDALVA